jgi:threonine dehydrogenase-like Zn-dependent dehydrogenase
MQVCTDQSGAVRCPRKKSLSLWNRGPSIGCNPVEETFKMTGGRGVDVAMEALGTQATFEAALRVLRPGGTLSSLGLYSTDLKIPLAAFAVGLGDHTIVTTLCPDLCRAPILWS